MGLTAFRDTFVEAEPPWSSVDGGKRRRRLPSEEAKAESAQAQGVLEQRLSICPGRKEGGAKEVRKVAEGLEEPRKLIKFQEEGAVAQLTRKEELK
ncbi:hypothetical protein NDU88_003829 [Pleurodeles waltl]|uniref:Uncharacterized protein n=1 Tax=Pleurodeles waltl TaxID=8319 RepID=A0AAV7V148_PLEWA|nr:hypothetical protein NDU88_003829 [Pleurodeles waltl]